MSKYFLCLLLTASAVLAQYKTEAAGAPPSELAPGVSSLLNKEGIKISDGGKVVAEVWFRSALPGGGKAEDSKSFATVPHGALIGAIRFPANWSDRRGQKVPAGVYTLRYSLFPQNGNHQGVAPQRDFLLLLKTSDDTDGNKNFDYDQVTTLSMKSIGTPHPAVFSIWKPDAADFKPGVAALGDNDQVLNVKIGDTPLSMIFLGKAES
jgi:hypothetical protein